VVRAQDPRGNAASPDFPAIMPGSHADPKSANSRTPQRLISRNSRPF
jgi:hypothetical protein